MLGRDTDAAFYGLTTLYQILQQVNGLTIQGFTLQDHADVVSRGFIEGYYGNPWSTEDRVNLMTWGGYYKLNAYVYAPKDDPKHRAHWRELYTADEVANELAPQAAAGNASKVRFVYALAPFHDEGDAKNPFRFDTEEHYQEDLKVLKAKYQQTIEAGVRQIALLADDSRDWGKIYGNEATYLRVLNDLTDWIHELQAQKNADGTPVYEGLKDTILYCPALWSYTGGGEAWYQQMPENVQVVMTGGRTFGIANHAYAQQFKGNTGRAPFLWINWPCTDMARNFSFDWLTMGGHNTFLKSDVVPGDLDGIMLNPMQQSEPSKQGIFMMADYSWNLWTSEAEGDQAWMDSFSYIEHNSPIANAASDGLRALSANMRVHRDGGIDGTINDPDYDLANRWWKNHESEFELAGADIASTLTAAQEKLASGTISAAEIDQVRAIYAALGRAAADYRAGAGDQNLLAQMEPFVGAWDDMARAGVAYADAVKAKLAGDTATAQAKLTEAEAAHTDSMTKHKLDYLGTQKDAYVGLVVVMPTLTSMGDYVKAADAETPTPGATVTTSDNMVPTRWAQHDGLAAVADGNPQTFAWLQNTASDSTLAGAWVQVAYGEPKHARTFTYVQAKEGGDTLTDGVLAYRDLAGAWHEVGAIDGRETQSFTLDSAVDVSALRVTNNAATGKWWQVYELGLTEEAAGPADTTALASALAAAKAVDEGTAASWTRDAREELAAAIAAGEAALANDDLAQAEADALSARLNAAAAGVARFTLMMPEELAGSKVEPGRYSEATYNRYLTAYNALAEALKDADNLPASVGDPLAEALVRATSNMEVDRTSHDLAELALADATDFEESAYTAESWSAFKAAHDALAAALADDPNAVGDPAEYDRLAAALADAIAGLKAAEEPGGEEPGGEEPGGGQPGGEQPGGGTEQPGGGTGQTPGGQQPTPGETQGTGGAGGGTSKDPSDSKASGGQGTPVGKVKKGRKKGLPKTGDASMAAVAAAVAVGAAALGAAVIRRRRGSMR